MILAVVLLLVGMVLGLRGHERPALVLVAVGTGILVYEITWG